MKDLVLKNLKISFDPLKEWEKHYGYHELERRGKHFCGRCGKYLKECSCNIKLRPLEKYAKYKTKRGFYQNSIYYMTTENVDNNLMLRYFLISVDEHIGSPADNLVCHEVMRYSINQKGKVVFNRKDVKSFMYNWDFIYNTELSTHKYADRYDFNAYADGKLLKPKWLKYCDLKLKDKVNNILKKNNSLSVYLTTLDVVKMYIENPTFIETMTKCKRYDLLAYRQAYRYVKLDNELMFMLRKGRTIKNRQWADYVVGLRTLGMDTHNIDILDPKDFVTANASVEKRCKKLQTERQLLENIATYNEDYLKKVDNLLNVDFGNDNYQITILPDVRAFYEEGYHMCHCVYRMGYYKNQNSYIFSVRNKENKRLETAEIKFDDGKIKIAQCYGYGDKKTEYHDEIIKLLSSKLNDIKNIIGGKNQCMMN